MFVSNYFYPMSFQTVHWLQDLFQVGGFLGCMKPCKYSLVLHATYTSLKHLLVSIYAPQESSYLLHASSRDNLHIYTQKTVI